MVESFALLEDVMERFVYLQNMLSQKKKTKEGE